MNKVFDAKTRVYVFSARARSGFGDVNTREVRLIPLFGAQTVEPNAECTTIYHGANQAGLGAIFTPNWATTCFLTAMGADDMTVCFGSPAPVSGGLLQWELYF